VYQNRVSCGVWRFYIRQASERYKTLEVRDEDIKAEEMRETLAGREEIEDYDESSDTYICHAGKTLSAIYMKKQKSKNGYESNVTVYECSDCNGCPYKDKGTKAKGNKRLYVSKNFISQRQISYENIMSETGTRYRMNRSIQVEGAFAVFWL